MFFLFLASGQSHKKQDALLAEEELTICNSEFAPTLLWGAETEQNQAFLTRVQNQLYGLEMMQIPSLLNSVNRK